MSDLDVSNLRPVGLGSDDKATDDVLVGTCHIFGVPMHLTAIRVYGLDDHAVHPVDPGREEDLNIADAVAIDQLWQEELDFLDQLSQCDGPFRRAQIPGYEGEYIVFVYPNHR